jgi:hypothetical protein
MIDLKDAYDLANTICRAFHEERSDEFETLNGKPETIKDEGSTFLFYDTRLEALLAYKAFIAHKDKTINAAMLWREKTWTIKGDPKVNWGEDFIVLIDVNYDQINGGQFDG